MITVKANGRGKIPFCALDAVLDIQYGRLSIDFTSNGSNEMDRVEGDGLAELLDDDSIEIGFTYRNDDEAVAKRCFLPISVYDTDPSRSLSVVPRHKPKS